MAGIKDLTNVWTNIKQVDLRPLVEEAERGVKFALVGREGSGRHELAAQMRRDPSRVSEQTQTPILITDLETAQSMQAKIADADLVILLQDGGRTAAEDSIEHTLANAWSNSGTKVLIFANSRAQGEAEAVNSWMGADRRRLVVGPVDDAHFLVRVFVPAVMDLLPDQHLALGRHFPLFRIPIAHRMINETSFSNAAYAFSTGLAGIVPVLDIPLNVTDMVVLTKNQAFLAFKLGLALGLSTRWQDYVAEFGSVLGGGFLWRQIARSLVGLIPAWGIIPKAAIAYSGTYVVGHVVLNWYLTGRHVTPEQMRKLYSQAFARGKHLARDLAEKMPRPRLGRRKRAQLPPPKVSQVCPNCGRNSALDAQFCQYCGQPFSPALPEGSTTGGGPSD